MSVFCIPFPPFFPPLFPPLKYECKFCKKVIKDVSNNPISLMNSKTDEMFGIAKRVITYSCICDKCISKVATKEELEESQELFQNLTEIRNKIESIKNQTKEKIDEIVKLEQISFLENLDYKKIYFDNRSKIDSILQKAPNILEISKKNRRFLKRIIKEYINHKLKIHLLLSKKIDDVIRNSLKEIEPLLNYLVKFKNRTFFIKEDNFFVEDDIGYIQNIKDIKNDFENIYVNFEIQNIDKIVKQINNLYKTTK